MNKSRKVLLTTHIAVSVGWIGAVLVYIALVLAAMAGQGDQLLRAVWITLNLIGWYVIVPLALAALISGIGIALGTPWGLFRHYWVATSLLLTAVAAGVLLQHMSTVTFYANIAANASITEADNVLRSALRGELLHAGIGVLVLLGLEALNVFKPRGLTAYGRNRPVTIADSSSPSRAVGRKVARVPRWAHAVWIHTAVFVLLVAILHAAGFLRLHG